MPSTLWENVIAQPASRHLLVGRVDASFAGGGAANDGFDSDRLRSAVSLMARCCSKLKLQGSFALEGRLEEGEPQVQIVMDHEADFLSLCQMTSSSPTRAGAWKSQSQFVLDQALCAQLLEITGQPDDNDGLAT